MRTNLLPLAPLFTLVLLGAGCAPAAAPPAANAPAAAPAERTLTPTAVTLPPDFPSDVLQYPGSTIFSHVENVQPGQAILSLTTRDASATVLAWYDAQYPSAGFAAGAAGTRGNATSHEYTKGDVTMTVTVIDQGSGKDTLVSVVRRQETQE